MVDRGKQGCTDERATTLLPISGSTPPGCRRNLAFSRNGRAIDFMFSIFIVALVIRRSTSPSSFETRFEMFGNLLISKIVFLYSARSKSDLWRTRHSLSLSVFFSIFILYFVEIYVHIAQDLEICAAFPISEVF